MHRNTALIITILSICAALLIGINIGRKLSGSQSPQLTLIPSSTPSTIFNSPSPISSSSSLLKNYENRNCGITYDYPSEFTLNEASNAARLTDKENNTTIDMACLNSIPRPPLTPDKQEQASIGGQITTIYHDQKAENGSPVDVVVLTNAKLNMDIALMGFGNAFNQLLKTVKLLQ